MTGRQNVHATGIVLGEAGVMLRGPSGAGKSLLALLLLERWQARGEAALLVADDRLELEPRRGEILMHAPERHRGRIELRGRGIVSRPSLAHAPVHLVVDLLDALDRMPEESALTTELLGITIARCPVPVLSGGGADHQLLLVAEALRQKTLETAKGRSETPARVAGGRPTGDE
jgi:serine kinase of HPr protein (carbohydrate metabolism regulator)